MVFINVCMVINISLIVSMIISFTVVFIVPFIFITICGCLFQLMPWYYLVSCFVLQVDGISILVHPTTSAEHLISSYY